MENKIQHVFNAAAQNYDALRRKLIPCYNDFYSAAVSAVDSVGPHPKILDLGAGTGLLSSFMLRKFPDCSLTLIDISSQMLQIAKERFKHNPSVRYINDDFLLHNFTENYDIIISALAIHHLTGEEKQLIYNKCFKQLNSGGCFVNADQVSGETDFIENRNKENWRNAVENSGLTRDEIMAAYERVKLDKMSILSDQLTWLKQAGFNNVDCLYKNYSFVVFSGNK